MITCKLEFPARKVQVKYIALLFVLVLKTETEKKPVSRRVNLNQGRRIIIADGE